MMLILMSYLLLTLIVAIGLRFFPTVANQLGLQDVPNHRSLHSQIKPRSGGLVFLLGWWAWLGVAIHNQWLSLGVVWPLLPSTLLISAIGLLDDRFTLRAKTRLIVHIVAVALFLMQLGPLSHWHIATLHWHLGTIVGSTLAALALLWSINLFNFMDGLDGLAGTEALCVLIPGGVFYALTGAHDLSLMAWSLGAAIAGFLWWNWPSARLFMGDVGSTTLGFVLVALPLTAQRHYDMSVIPWMILYSTFFVDATATLLRRLWQRENITQAHRSHAYQQLSALGWSHAQVLWAVMGLNTMLIALACWAFWAPQWEGVALTTALATVIGLYKKVQQQAGTLSPSH